MLWRTRAHTFDLATRGLIMGVLNVTADSFSDGGQFFAADAAIAHGRQMAAEGADLIDVGGESTRPGAQPVSEEEELRRVLPVIEQLATLPRVVLSIDTMKPGVARAAVERGAGIINDVSGYRDAAMREVARETGAGAIAMHMQGSPETMQTAPHYENVVAEIRDFFRQTLASCLRSGMDPERIAFDPGIGFGKTLEHNLTLLRNLDSLQVDSRPLAVGVSRKSFLGKLLGSTAPEDRAWPTVALTSFLRTRGAAIFRVHEVRPNAEALRMTEAILT